MFSDSIDDNLETIRELLGGIPPSERNKAKRAAVLLENTFTQIAKANPKDPAVGLGAAFAIFTLAQRLVQAPQQGDSDKGLIELLK